ncbi:MAG: flagellar filament capping protein FliD [Lachnospiraceae bacterium]|nr:flagellar filament capping protein FliD [Lachnospiraceae bacterium]
MASISSTSSLGNTSLRGFGGMASGIERDEIIEQMTLGTTTKINNAKKDITKLEWKQEAYRAVSDKIIDLSDKYGTYSSASSLVDPTFFAKNQISIHGSEKSSKYVTATGSSALVGSISLSAVKQLATASVQQSATRTGGALKTDLNDLSETTDRSNLEGTKLIFGVSTGSDGKYQTVTFEFPESYETDEDDGKGGKVKKTINYTPKTEAEWQELAEDLTKALQKKQLKIGEGVDLSEAKFEYTADGKIQLTGVKGDVQISKSSSALKALGYTADDKSGYISVGEFNTGVGDFKTAAVSKPTKLEEMTGSKVSFNYNGSQKQIELITKAEAEELKSITDKDEQMRKLQENLQKRLDTAYGTGNVIVGLDGADGRSGNLQFTTADPGASISIVSGDRYTIQGLGVSYGESNKINLNGKLDQNNLNINLDDEKYKDGLIINGVKIDGVTKNSSISDILSKINNSKAGVKATYVDATGQFMLVTSETGKGREIDLEESELAKELFGGAEADGAKFTEGQDAIIEVGYGNGVKVEMNRSSNTFNLEGLTITVSGVFGGEYGKKADGTIDKDNWISDSSDTITFTAKADIDGVTERVKGFFEDFNAMVKEVNSQVTTRPDSSYTPLTDEQKAEMSETSIENWEKKAKQGLLYGDSAMRDLSTDIQGIFVKMMNSGASYEDLKKIGITYSDDYLDGGTLVFDEAKFRTAMENDPDMVANIFTGGGDVSKGLTKIVDETLTPYATRYASRNGNSYGRLIEEAGSEKAPTTMMNNFIYKQIKGMQDKIESLQSKLKIEQDRYIKQFSTMESLISQMNSQSSWLSQLSG